MSDKTTKDTDFYLLLPLEVAECLRALLGTQNVNSVKPDAMPQNTWLNNDMIAACGRNVEAQEYLRKLYIQNKIDTEGGFVASTDTDAPVQALYQLVKLSRKAVLENSPFFKSKMSA